MAEQPRDSAQIVPSDVPRYSLHPERRRSLGFVEGEGQSWSCFLVTHRAALGRWKGFLEFRSRDADFEELRTANIFIESSEDEIDHKARGLGRPLIVGLLRSALEVAAVQASEVEASKIKASEVELAEPKPVESPPTRALRGWFRDLLAQNAEERTARDRRREGERVGDVALVRARYASYRMDQVAHLIALTEPEAFEATVREILEGQSFSFGAKDRLQFAMIVVDRLESLLPLPPFEVWEEDQRRHPREYELYGYELYRSEGLP